MASTGFEGLAALYHRLTPKVAVTVSSRDSKCARVLICFEGGGVGRFAGLGAPVRVLWPTPPYLGRQALPTSRGKGEPEAAEVAAAAQDAELAALGCAAELAELSASSSS